MLTKLYDEKDCPAYSLAMFCTIFLRPASDHALAAQTSTYRLPFVVCRATILKESEWAGQSLAEHIFRYRN
jgi:hypothetical protein